MAADLYQLILEMLRQPGGVLYERVGDRVYASPGAPSDLAGEEALEFEVRGGEEGVWQGVVETEVVFRGLGASPSLACGVLGALHELIHGRKMVDVQVTGGESPGRYRVLVTRQCGAMTVHPRRGRRPLWAAEAKWQVWHVAMEAAARSSL